MARTSTLTEQQIQQIYQFKDAGKSERQIAALVGISSTKVHTALTKRGAAAQQEKIAALVSSSVAQETKKSVFDIMARLEECLDEIQSLVDEDVGVLKDRVAARTEKRMLIAEARATLESIYNIRVLNDFIAEVVAILEEQAPGARARIFERLEVSTGAIAAISLFASKTG